MQRNKIVIKDLDFQNSKHVKSLRYLNCSVNKIERLLLIEQPNTRNPILYPSIALKHSLFKKWLLQTKQPVFSTISKANCAPTRKTLGGFIRFHGSREKEFAICNNCSEKKKGKRPLRSNEDNEAQPEYALDENSDLEEEINNGHHKQICVMSPNSKDDLQTHHIS